MPSATVAATSTAVGATISVGVRGRPGGMCVSAGSTCAQNTPIQILATENNVSSDTTIATPRIHHSRDAATESSKANLAAKPDIGGMPASDIAGTKKITAISGAVRAMSPRRDSLVDP